MGNETKILKHLHYFRGFAILNILIVHIWQFPAGYENFRFVGLIDSTRELLFHNSTIYFLFISGFLFYYLSPKFTLKKYYRSKFLNVILPYIFLTFVITLLHSVLHSGFSLSAFIRNLTDALLQGSAQVQYWYIPFIAIVFLISPLLLRIPKDFLKKIALVSFLLPVLGTRTSEHITLLQYVYFFPVYLTGIYAAMDYQNFIIQVKRWRVLLIVLAAGSTLLLSMNHESIRYFEAFDPIESLFYIQKISLCFLGISVFLTFENKEIVWLDYFARFSFAIYFTHTLVGNYMVNNFYYSQVFSMAPNFIIPLSVLYVSLIASINVLIILAVKKILGKRSRYFIGA